MSATDSDAPAVAALTASARSLGGTLRHEVVVDHGRHRIITDEPAHLGGTDTGPAPHELLPAALAACVSTTILMYARTRHWEIGDVRVDVEYNHRATPRTFAIVVHLDPSLPPDRVARLTKIAEGCPVRRAIEDGIEFDERVVLDSPPQGRSGPSALGDLEPPAIRPTGVRAAAATSGRRRARPAV
jgi:putative redox protein